MSLVFFQNKRQNQMDKIRSEKQYLENMVKYKDLFMFLRMKYMVNL